MRKVIFGGANTVDNYIAGKGDSIDWIRHTNEVNDIMKDYWSRIDTVGGRRALTVRYARGPARATVTVIDAAGLEGHTPAGAVVREAGGRTRLVTGTGATSQELGALAAAVGGEGRP